MKPLSFRSTLLLLPLSLLLANCAKIVLPPVFVSSQLDQYAVDNGTDVPFTVAVNYATSVSCFGGALALTQTPSTNQWTGTALYSSNLSNHAVGETAGVNTIACTATNASGGGNMSTSTGIGKITLIPNMLPILSIKQPINICGNTGSLQIDEVLVDPSSKYITGATYTLTAGSLPSGLSIKQKTGNLMGSTTSGDHSATNLKITATTAKGAVQSADFSINIHSSTSPCL